MTNSAEFVARFIEKLGNVKDWDHNGVVTDLGSPVGHCVCGHPIQYEFELVNKINGKTAVVGSDCINNFKDYSPELYNSLMATVERKAKEEKEAKELLQAKELEELKDTYERLAITLKNWYTDQRNKKIWVDYEVYSLVNSVSKNIPVRKTLRGYISYYTKKIEEISALMEKHAIISSESPIINSSDIIEIKESIQALVTPELSKVLNFLYNPSIKYPLYSVLENYKFSITDATFNKEDLHNLSIVISSIKEDFNNHKIVKYVASGKTYDYRDFFKSNKFIFNYETNAWEKYDYANKDFNVSKKVIITIL